MSGNVTVTVYGDQKNNTFNYVVIGNSGKVSDAGQDVLHRFTAKSAPGPGLVRWDVLKARHGIGNWVRPEGGEAPPKGGDASLEGSFYARPLPLSPPPPQGSVCVRFRAAKVGKWPMQTDPHPATSVGLSNYTDTAWKLLYAFEAAAGGAAHADPMAGAAAKCPSPPRQGQGVWELPNSRYPLRRACRVTLFQSAHVGSLASTLPPVQVYGGRAPGCPQSGAKKLHSRPAKPWQTEDNTETMPRPYLPRNLWEEVYEAVLSAKHFIYCIGWSVNTEISMIRERPVPVEGYPDYDDKLGMSIGDMLKKKADEGVVVCVNVWKDTQGIGIAGTFSAETCAYFAGTKVTCKEFVRQDQDASTMVGTSIAFSHHQKCIIVDSAQVTIGGEPPPDDRRRVVAYMGGIDITKGRFDTPDHPIFSSLQGQHKGDFYQPGGGGVTADEGPRQPWQDVHGKIEGAIARDLVNNFEQRWLTQTTQAGGHQKLFGAGKGLVSGMSGAHRELLNEEEEWVVEQGHPESWNIQFLRSIDKNSDKYMDWDGWHMSQETDIEKAYVNAIPKAKRFIYIENQYFMGSSLASREIPDNPGFQWPGWKYKRPEHKKGGIRGLVGGMAEKLTGECGRTPQNRIAMMLTTRICKAIRSGEDFAVYLNIPLFPEGEPADPGLQEIVHWEYKTMQTMYEVIRKELKEARSSKDPRDYLNIYTVGTREPGASQAPPAGLDPKSRRAQLIKNKRHMIYVHSKFMVIDDEFAIWGSANINDRSMEGNRDTEMAVAAYQPAFSRECEGPLTGHIHGYRISVWGQHLSLNGGSPERILDPGNPACVRWIRERAEHSWKQHSSDELMAQDSHLMVHPTGIAAFCASAGEEAPGGPMAELPDAPGALIVGQPSQAVPDWITC